MKTFVYRIYRDWDDNEITNVQIEGELYNGSVVSSYANHGYQCIASENRGVSRVEIPITYSTVQAHNRHEAQVRAMAECGLLKQIWK